MAMLLLPPQLLLAGVRSQSMAAARGKPGVGCSSHCTQVTEMCDARAQMNLNSLTELALPLA